MSLIVYDSVHWGRPRLPSCYPTAGGPAELVIDETPACIDCADRFIKRQVAIGINPDVRSVLPRLEGSSA